MGIRKSGGRDQRRGGRAVRRHIRERERLIGLCGRLSLCLSASKGREAPPPQPLCARRLATVHRITELLFLRNACRKIIPMRRRPKRSPDHWEENPCPILQLCGSPG